MFMDMSISGVCLGEFSDRIIFVFFKINFYWV